MSDRDEVAESTEQTAAERPRFICEYGHNIVGGGPDERCTVPLTAGGDIWTNPWPPPENVVRCNGEMEWERVEPGAVAAAVAEERRACAELVEADVDALDPHPRNWFIGNALTAAAAAIRSRGEAT